MQNSEGVNKTLNNNSASTNEHACLQVTSLQGDIRFLLEQNFTSLLSSHLAFSYAFKPGCLMRHN